MATQKKSGLGLKAIGQTMNPKLKQAAPETTPVAAGVKTARISHKATPNKPKK